MIRKVDYFISFAVASKYAQINIFLTVTNRHKPATYNNTDA